MKIQDKWDKSINIQKASIGKLKAMLTWMEEIAYRSSDNKNPQILIDLLPDEYGVIVDELNNRNAKPYVSFHWVK